MPEIILPCPNCQTNLLVDEGNAGHDVLCPGCEVRLRLPQDLSGRTMPVVAGVAAPAAGAAAEPVDHEEARRNFRLHRTGHLNPVADEEEAPAAHRSTPLPSRGRRDLDAPEEMRRLASMAAAPASFDLHNVDTKGRLAFPCPACQRPVWMTPGDAGRVLPCPGCARSVVAPDPAQQQPARLLDEDEAAAPRQKTVLPARRQVENFPLGEQTAAGRPKRQGAQMPAARESIRGPVPTVEERAHTPAPGQEPIPARGDVELSATVHRGPAAPRRSNVLTEAQERASVAAEFEANTPAPAPDPGPPGARHFQKSSGDRIPSFSPRHELDLSPEATGAWGSEGKPENTAGFRRTLTTAIIVLIVGGAGIAAYLLKSNFSEKENTVEKRDAENPVAGVDGAKETVRKFFAAKTPAEMAKFIRHPEASLPKLQKYYTEPANVRLREGFSTDWFTEDWREVDDYLGSGVDFIVTSLQPKGESAMTAMLEIPKDGSPPLLDWEHFVAWSDTKWDDFLRTTSERATEFRVSVTQIDYYNFAYNDRSRYLAFRVADSKNSAHCYAYCEARSKLANLLLDAVRKGRQSGFSDPTGEGIARVILRLKFLPEGKANNQAVIDALVWDDWLQP